MMAADDPHDDLEKMIIQTFDRSVIFKSFITDGQIVLSTESSTQSPEDRARDEAVRREKSLRANVQSFLLKTEHDVVWDDVVGNEAAKRALIDAIEGPVKHKELYQYYDKKPCKGILLYGPPGCGKTLFGKAAASIIAQMHKSEGCEYPLLSIKGPELQTSYVGQTEAIIRNIFAYARAFKNRFGFPLVIFIDEVDAILPDRNGAGGRKPYGYEESQVAQFLAEMDGLDEASALVILATNRPHAIDAAFTRDGSCDHKIKVERPNRQAAQHIIAKSLKDVPIRNGLTPGNLADHAVEILFSGTHRLARFDTGKSELYFTLSDIINGAMMVGLVEKAKDSAFRRDLMTGKRSGIGFEDMEAAIDMIFEQNKRTSHSFALDEFVQRHNIQEAHVFDMSREETRPMLN